jgi:hypothetical protein
MNKKIIIILAATGICAVPIAYGFYSIGRPSEKEWRYLKVMEEQSAELYNVSGVCSSVPGQLLRDMVEELESTYRLNSKQEDELGSASLDGTAKGLVERQDLRNEACTFWRLRAQIEMDDLRYRLPIPSVQKLTAKWKKENDEIAQGKQ